MYTEFYHFEEKPFGLTPNPAYLFLSESHRVALNHLTFGIDQREGFILITGDVGTGKTTLCRALLARLRDGYRTAYVFNPILSPKDLLETILEEFGASVKNSMTKRDLMAQLNQLLLTFFKKDEKAVLIIDEAQDLEADTLENIRLLSNLETTKEKLLQIILAGQPELEEKLALHSLRQLRQRITIRHKLRPLTLRETQAYILHRVTIAGPQSMIRFDDAAIKTIHKLSAGVPRVINQITDRALLAGYVNQRRIISRALVRKGVKALSIQRHNTGGHFLKWLGIATACVLLGGVGYWGFVKNMPDKTGKISIIYSKQTPTVRLIPKNFRPAHPANHSEVNPFHEPH